MFTRLTVLVCFYFIVLFQIKIMGVDFTCEEDVFLLLYLWASVPFHQSCVILLLFLDGPAMFMLKLKRRGLMNRINLNYLKKKIETLNKPVFVIKCISSVLFQVFLTNESKSFSQVALEGYFKL